MEFDKSRIYTALNADELKVGDKVYVDDNPYDLESDVKNERYIAVITEIYPRNTTARFRVRFCHSELYDEYCLAYLVERAKEKKWRPFKDIQELIDAWREKTGVTARANTMPLIWVKGKRGYGEESINFIRGFRIDCDMVIIGGISFGMNGLFDEFTFLDGTPCGKEIEE